MENESIAKDTTQQTATLNSRPSLSKNKSTRKTVVKDTEQLEIDGFDPIYTKKAKLINEEIQRIGFGYYQIALFFVCGFGWFADNALPLVTSLILTPVSTEFGVEAPYLTLAQNIGLLFGAAFWGLGSDIIGRRWAFNLTFGIIGIFATAAAGSPTFAAVGIFACLWSTGVGGSLPVDSAIMIEFLPASHQWLLTVLSIWWAFGQLTAAMLAWPLIGNFSCPNPDSGCPKSENMGWRYYLIVMGGITLAMFIIRFFVFNLRESPKFLMGRGDDKNAVQTVHAIAKFNGTESELSIEQLKLANENDDSYNTFDDTNGNQVFDTSTFAGLRRTLTKFDLNHIRALFSTPKLAYSTSLIIAIWGLIGLAFPLYNAFLPFLLSNRGVQMGDGSVYITYRNAAIIAVTGVPGALIGGFLVELPRLGRRGALCLCTILTGVFLFASTTANSSNELLGWNCGYSVTSNAMYGVLYAYTPEILPTQHRGTGTGLAASANRVLGVFAPVIALKADLSTSAPVYVSGALFLFTGLLVLSLPYEPNGRASL